MKLKIFLLVIISSLCVAQNSSNKVLTKIGNKEITVEEFKIRYELSPQISRSQSEDSLQKKEDFLHSLIAEKLWALEAENLNFDSTDIMRFTFPAIEKMYIRDVLYTKEIKEKTSISSEEYKKFLERSNYNLLTRFISSDDKSIIEESHASLKKGEPFDSIYLTFSADERNGLEIKLDDLKENVEDNLFTLKKNEVSEPIFSNGKWYIFHIDGFRQNSYTTDSEIRTRDALIRRVAEQRAIGKTYSSYFNNFFKEKKIQSDGYIFWSFANKIISILKGHAENAKEDGEQITSLKLKPGDLEKINSMFGSDSLTLPFVTLENRQITLREFIHDFVLEGFYTSTLNQSIIRSQLQSRVKYFIERELLADEAISKGLQNDPEAVRVYEHLAR
jgi:hypothetical protein